MRRILCIISAIILLASCRGEDDGVLSVASSQEPQTLDVMMSTSVSGRSIASGNIYEKLISTDAEGHIIPVLAESWELSDDGRELVFRLRSGVRFHDGTALDPGDAAASMNRWLSVYENAESITGDARFSEGEGMISIRASSSIALLPEMIATAPQCAVIMQTFNYPYTVPQAVLSKEICEATGMDKVFYQNQFPKSVVEVIARDMKARYVEIDPLDEQVVGNIDRITDLIVEP